MPIGGAQLTFGRTGIKLNFFHVKCELGLAGLKQCLPSEGYSHWAFGWRLDVNADIRLRNVFNGIQSGLEDKGVPGRPVAWIPLEHVLDFLVHGKHGRRLFLLGRPRNNLWTLKHESCTLGASGCYAWYQMDAGGS
ncbi:hypothetical protein WJX81_001550 [Elliptochloris bilobata]|uniref:Uncharacterized protein n=1 Tax=Elliptochloris bilobata TaxID=381761 RepID=A0AAW1SA49_9CHLO